MVKNDSSPSSFRRSWTIAFSLAMSSLCEALESGAFSSRFSIAPSTSCKIPLNASRAAFIGANGNS
jgi:hypothetical protein